MNTVYRWNDDIQSKTEVLRFKTFLLPLCPPQILRGLPRYIYKTQAQALESRRLRLKYNRLLATSLSSLSFVFLYCRNTFFPFIALNTDCYLHAIKKGFYFLYSSFIFCNFIYQMFLREIIFLRLLYSFKRDLCYSYDYRSCSCYNGSNFPHKV